MAQNRFRPYNKSLLINLFMSSDYKTIWNSYFIPKYEDINNHSKYDWTALMNACYNHYFNVIRLLLSYPKIDVSVVNDYGYAALYYAIESRSNQKIINLLEQYTKTI